MLLLVENGNKYVRCDYGLFLAYEVDQSTCFHLLFLFITFLQLNNSLGVLAWLILCFLGTILANVLVLGLSMWVTNYADLSLLLFYPLKVGIKVELSASETIAKLLFW